MTNVEAAAIKLGNLPDTRASRFAMFRNEGTLTSATTKPRAVVGRRIWPAVTFATVKAARSAWYDADYGNANHMLVLPADTPEYSYYPATPIPSKPFTLAHVDVTTSAPVMDRVMTVS